ncbi:thioesterase family protein [Roseivirga sp. E12]|uniref:acyl-CoA thioesterase n=1 Tax=Roseivirga sp. E12 TaxID=2819237 RepID=UPI001ABC1A19|nr:acyl-CoA thioesterase [Roseivirga sp. E12]MBO3696937.1 acyl-CoA thioesterase [Roseivirga sp. E12]
MEKPNIFSKTLVVNQGHLDELNHVNNVQYLQWIQDVAKQHWEVCAEQQWVDKYAWVALSHFIEYKKPAFLNDTLLIQTHVHEFDGVKSNRLVRISNQASGDLIVQSSTSWCMLDREKNRPTRVLEAMVEAFSD